MLGQDHDQQRGKRSNENRSELPQRPVKGFVGFGIDFAIVLLRVVQVIRQVPSSIQPVAVRWLSSELRVFWFPC